MRSDGLKRLKVWFEAKDLALFVNRKILPTLPPEEKRALGSQIRRSVTSIPANIAEGYGRYYYLTNNQFCYNACGSLEEMISHVQFAFDAGFIQSAKAEVVLKKADALSMLINGYIAYLRKSKQRERLTTEPQVKEQGTEYIINLAEVGEFKDFDNSQFSTLDSQD